MAKGLNRRAFIKMASGAAAAVSANWFLPKFSSAAVDEIRIGGLFELSGGLSTLGVVQAKGAEYAIKVINETGGAVGSKPGVLGKPVKLLVEDTESKVPSGLAKAKKLVERDKVHVLTGITMSSISIAVQEYIKEKKIPFFNTGSGNEALVTPPNCGRYFFKGLIGTPQSALAVQYPARKYGNRVYFVADDYTWGYTYVKFFKKALELMGKPEVVGEDYTPFNTDNYAPFITKAMAAKPAFLVAAVAGGYARFITQANQMGLKIPIHHPYFSKPDVKAAGDAALGLTCGGEFLIDNPKVPRAKKFAEGLKAFTGDTPGATEAHAFNGVEMICKAIQQAGGLDPDKIVEALENMVFQESVIMPGYKFRKCDHGPTVDVYVLEVIKHPEYGYDVKMVEQIKDPEVLMLPCGQTGCEEAMKKS
ncbi:MAG: ABC transporter substrate-binding protein [Thermodesulfobacteriota bacterium]